MRAVRVSSADGDMAASSSGWSAQMSGDQQLVVLISERQGRIVGLPTHQCYSEVKVRVRSHWHHIFVHSLILRMGCCTRVLKQ